MDPLTEVTTGFSVTVFSTADGRCVKVARDREAAGRRRREVALLEAIAGRLDVEVQSPARHLSSVGWPYPAVLSPWLDGRHACADDDPASVAAFLRRLHAIDPGDVAGLVEPYQRWWQRQRATVAAGLAAVADRVGPDELRWLRRFRDRLDTAPPTVSHPVLVHGDLWHENMLVREGRLTGVVDWEFAAIGDPAADVAGLWYLGDEWAGAVVSELDDSGELKRRAQCFRVVRELYGAAWSVEHSDADELTESVEKLATVVSAVRSSAPLGT